MLGQGRTIIGRNRVGGRWHSPSTALFGRPQLKASSSSSSSFPRRPNRHIVSRAGGGQNPTTTTLNECSHSSSSSNSTLASANDGRTQPSRDGYHHSLHSTRLRRCESHELLQRHLHHHRQPIIRTRTFASWQGHGTDLLSDSLDHQGSGGGGDPLPKIILKAYGSTGIDVMNSVKNMDPNDEELTNSGGIVHYTSSIIAFPTSCFLWNNVRHVSELTIESLTPIVLYQPSLEYLFIGTSTTAREIIPPYQLKDIKDKLEQQITTLRHGKSVIGRNNLVVEQMDLVSLLL